MKKNAPLIITLYNRPYQTINAFKFLKRNSLSKLTDLIIFSDGYKKNNLLDKKKVEIVRDIIANTSGFKSKKVFFRKKNFGLYKNTMSAIDYAFKRYDKAIFTEDDLIVSKYFLDNMNKALDLYSNEKNVSAIHSWFCEHNNKILNTFFLKGADTYGWASWKRSWEDFKKNQVKSLNKFKNKPNLIKEFNYMGAYDYYNQLKKSLLKQNDSWSSRWMASNFFQNKYYLNFSNSLSINFGNDGTGTHGEKNEALVNQQLKEKKISIKKQPIVEYISGRKIKANFLNKSSKKNNLITRVVNKFARFKSILNKKITLSGPFKNWETAKSNSKGYNDEEIFKKVLKNTLISNKNLFYFERDGELITKNSISIQLLYLIKKILLKKKKPLNIVDFGGALGSNYFKIKDIIDHKYLNKWNIVEQKSLVNIGKKYFKYKNLKFFSKLENLKNKKIDLIILSSSIQYVENPEKIMNEIFKLKPNYILIDRTPIIQKIKNNEIFVQKRAKNTYPLWIFSDYFFRSLFKNYKYKIVEKLSSEFDHNLFVNKRIISFGGYIYKLQYTK